MLPPRLSFGCDHYDITDINLQDSLNPCKGHDSDNISIKIKRICEKFIIYVVFKGFWKDQIYSEFITHIFSEKETKKWPRKNH